MSLESSQFSVRKLVIPVEKLVVPVEKLVVPVERFNVFPRNAPSTGTSSPWHGHPARDPSRPGRPCHLRPYHGHPARDPPRPGRPCHLRPYHGHPARGPELPPVRGQNPLVFRVFARLLRSYINHEEKKAHASRMRTRYALFRWERDRIRPLVTCPWSLFDGCQAAQSA